MKAGYLLAMSFMRAFPASPPALGDAGDCLVTSSMRAYLKRSLSMVSLRDNEYAGLAFTFILFLLQIHH